MKTTKRREEKRREEKRREEPRQEIQSAISFMQSEFHRSRLRVKEIAAAALTSPRSLERYFKEWCGGTVFHYLQQIRVEKATRMLIETQERINDIASACGFNDLPHFDRVFHEHNKCSPTEYREKNILS